MDALGYAMIAVGLVMVLGGYVYRSLKSVVWGWQTIAIGGYIVSTMLTFTSPGYIFVAWPLLAASTVIALSYRKMLRASEPTAHYHSGGGHGP